MTTALRDASPAYWVNFGRSESDNDSDLTASYDSAEAESRALLDSVQEALETTFKKYDVEARAPTILLNAVSVILGEQSLFLSDFTPQGVLDKIRSLRQRPWADFSELERQSTNKAMEEILDALARDEATRLLLSTSTEKNSVGQMILGAGNRNEYLETLRIYMADETSKSFMVSVADTTFELLQRILGKIGPAMKNLSSGYALWEVPFNAPGKQTKVGMSQCPVVLKRAWQRPTKIYFLTTEEAAARFHTSASNILSTSPGTASLSSNATFSTSQGSSELDDSSDIPTGANSNSNNGLLRPASASNIPRSASVKVWSDEGTAVTLILSTKGEKAENVRRRALVKFGLPTEETTHILFYQLPTDSAVSVSTASHSTDDIPTLTPSDKKTLAKHGKTNSAKSNPVSPAIISSASRSLTGSISGNSTPSKDGVDFSVPSQPIALSPEDDVSPLLIKHPGILFLLRHESQVAAKSRITPLKRKSVDRVDRASVDSSRGDFSRDYTSTAAQTAPINWSAKELKEAGARESPHRADSTGRRGSISLVQKAAIIHPTPEMPRDSILKADVKRSSSPKLSSSDISESSETSAERYYRSGPGSARGNKQSHTVYSKARTFQLTDLNDAEIEKAAAASYSRVTLGGAQTDLSPEERLKKVLDLLHSGGHRLNLSLQGFNLSFVPVGLRDIVKQPKSLDLSHNRLKTLPDWFDDAFANVRGLNLASNQLSSFEQLDGLHKVQTLDLSGNKMRTWPTALSNLTTLSRLYLNFNEMNLLPKSIAKLTGLKELAIAGNGLTDLPSSISKLTNLQILDIGYNRLRDAFVLHGLTRLTEIYAPSNEFYDLSAFYALSSLEVLDLSVTQITDVPRGINRLSRLTVLNLSRTPMTSEKDVLALRELLRMPSLVSTHWPSALEYLADMIAAEKAPANFNYSGSGNLSSNNSTASLKNSKESTRSRSSASQASLDSGASSSDSEDDSGDLKDVVKVKVPATAPVVITRTSPSASAVLIGEKSIPVIVPISTKPIYSKAEKAMFAEKSKAQMFAVPAAASPEAVSAFSTFAVPTAASPEAVPVFAQLMNGQSDSESDSDSMGAGIGSGRSPLTGRASAGNTRDLPRDSIFLNGGSGSGSKLATSGASRVARTLDLTKLSSSRDEMPKAAQQPMTAHAMSSAAKKRRKSENSPSHRGSAISSRSIGQSDDHIMPPMDRSGASSTESSPRAPSALSGMKGSARSGGDGAVSARSSSSSRDRQAIFRSASRDVSGSTGGSLAGSTEADPITLKRRNYSQRRFSTIGDVKSGAAGPYEGGKNGPTSVQLLDPADCDGFHTEQPRSWASMTEIPELSFQPANLRLAHGLDEYFTHFYDQNHTNFLAVDKNAGVVLMSVLLEREHYNNQEAYRVLVKSQTGDKTIWCPPSLLLGSKSSSSSSKKSVTPSVKASSVSFDRVVDYVIEAHGAGNLQLSSVKQLLDPTLSKEILEYESRMNYNAFKFGVLYAGLGSNEDEFYGNNNPSLEFENFIEFLGDTIRLQGWPHFSGGLDVNGNRTGRMSVYKRWASLEIMFHISTLLPFSVDDPQQIERKKHLGNDVVVIVFQDEGAPPFQPAMMKSYFNHVYLVIRTVTVNGVTKYTMATASKDGVLVHSPALPEPTLFDLNADFRRFLYTKLVNSERSSYEAPNFSKALCRTRLALLQDFSTTHAANPSNKKIKFKHKVK